VRFRARGAFLKFQIPDFPRGTLLATILFSVGLLIAFPEVPLGWAWLIILAAAFIVWGVGSGLVGPLGTDEVAGPDEQEPTDEGEQPRPSADFAALIKTIAAQGRANRDEERREDRSKQFREWTTIVLLALTVVGIFRQIDEMVKVYKPIRDQAKAAVDQAEAAKIQAQGAKAQADTAKEAAVTAHDNIVAAERAWVGPNGGTIEQAPAIGVDVRLHILYQNTGREPARGFVPTTDPFIATANDMGSATVRIFKNLSDCRNKQPQEGLEVVYPSTGFGGNQLNPVVDKSLVDDSVVKGDSVIFVPGCFVYETFGKAHHSAFCFYFKAGATVPPNLNFCIGGSDAD
jgi:hypothetical protein